MSQDVVHHLEVKDDNFERLDDISQVSVPSCDKDDMISQKQKRNKKQDEDLDQENYKKTCNNGA